MMQNENWWLKRKKPIKKNDENLKVLDVLKPSLCVGNVTEEKKWVNSTFFGGMYRQTFFAGFVEGRTKENDTKTNTFEHYNC